MATTEVIQKYLKVKALAERGAPGERDNAARIVASMLKTHPGLDQEAAAWERAQNGPEEDPLPSGVWPGEAEQTPSGDSKFGGNWEQIFNFARSAMNNAYDFANNMANAYLGRRIADEHVETTTKFTRSNNIIISFKMEVSVYEYLETLNTVQKQAFRQALHEYLDNELDELIGEE
jgi:hypothetical protein